MKRVVINLYGGPGTGKSTTAAHLFVLYKQAGVNCELVREYIKNWVWEERKVKPGDQYYIFTKQARLESITYKEVDVIVTDSPVWLGAIYEAKFEPEPHKIDDLLIKHQQLTASHGIEHVHIFLKRVKPYQAKGRFQNEEEAKVIDREILDYLSSHDIDYKVFEADNECAHRILKYVNKYRAS